MTKLLSTITGDPVNDLLKLDKWNHFKEIAKGEQMFKQVVNQA
jgi:hypothetical protein